MTTYHINPKGELTSCKAEYRCPFEGVSLHLEAESLADAYSQYEEKLRSFYEKEINNTTAEDSERISEEFYENGEVTVDGYLFKKVYNERSYSYQAVYSVPNSIYDEEIVVNANDINNYESAYIKSPYKELQRMSLENLNGEESMGLSILKTVKELKENSGKYFPQQDELLEEYKKIESQTEAYIPEYDLKLERTGYSSPETYEAEDDENIAYLRVRWGVASLKIIRKDQSSDDQKNEVQYDKVIGDSLQGSFDDTTQRNIFLTEASLYFKNVRKT